MRMRLAAALLAVLAGSFMAYLSQPGISEAITNVKIHVYPGVPYSQGYTIYNTCGWHIDCTNPDLGYERGLDFDPSGTNNVFFVVWSFSNDSVNTNRAVASFGSLSPDAYYSDCTSTSVTIRDYYTGVNQSRIYNIHTAKASSTPSMTIQAKRFDLGGVFTQTPNRIATQTTDNCNTSGTHNHMWYDGLVGGVYNIFPRDSWSGCGGTPAYSHKPSGFYFYCYDAPGVGVTMPQDLNDWV